MATPTGKVPNADIKADIGVRASIRKSRTSGKSKASLGIAKVTAVDYEEHKVSLRVMTGEDQEFQRVPVPMIYPGAGPRRFLGSMPEIGDYCVVGYINQESDGRSPIPVILGWMVMGTSTGYDWMTTQPFSNDEFPLDSKGSLFTKGVYKRIRHKLRHMEPGNIVASSSQGSDLVLNEDVMLSNRRGNEVILRDQDQAIITRACQQFTALSGTRTYSGMVQRDANLLPSSMISDGVQWETGKLVNPLTNSLYSDSELASVSPGRSGGELYPHPVFDRRRDGSLQDSNNSGVGFEPSIDPYEFLKRGLFVGDSGSVDSSSSPSAVYGGKPIHRVSAAVDNFGLPLNSMTQYGDKANSYTEHRVEISHVSDGQLPVTEQTDGFDAERLPRSRPDGNDKFNKSIKAPYIESVMGTVVGNDPFSRVGRKQYGIPLTPSIFNSSGKPEPKMEAATNKPLGEQAATYFRLSPPTPAGGPDTFWSTTKDGRLFSYIGGEKAKPFSVEMATLSGIKISSGGKIVFEADSGFEFKSGTGSRGENQGLNLASEKGSVRVYGGGRSTIGASAASSTTGMDPSNQPNLILEGKDNVLLRSSRKVVVNSGSFEQSVSSFLTNSLNGINLQAGESISLSSKTYNQVTAGKASYGFCGPKDGLPTAGAFRETTFTGIAVGPADKYLVVQGDREETFLLGNHKTTIVAGNFTYETNAGKYSIRAGANTVDVDFVSGMSASMTVGDTSFTNIAGGFSVNAQTTVSIRATATSILSGSGGVSLGGPGKVGGIVCGSDLDPLTGLPLATLGMGSPGHSLVTPI